ncbi:MAG: hypothetical protein PHX62_07725 [Bacilli bacterium]|nr:hypothetical protein [Bacilli bacterium]
MVVDYNQTIEQGIINGKYSWSFEEFNSNNFPVPSEIAGSKVEVIAKLFHFKSSVNPALFPFKGQIDTYGVIPEMDKDGYRPATLFELLALGAQYPLLQTQFPIAAMGSIWKNGLAGGPQMSCLVISSDLSRGLKLCSSSSMTPARYRFLGIYK